MTDIEQIKREVHEELGYPEHPISRVIDYLHSRGYLGGVPEPVEELLKQAKNILDAYNLNGFHNKIIHDIDKFLGEK